MHILKTKHSAANVEVQLVSGSSVSTHSYLGVSAHTTDSEWKLQSFALIILTDTRHYADACVEHLLSVGKVKRSSNHVNGNLTKLSLSLPFSARDVFSLLG